MSTSSTPSTTTGVHPTETNLFSLVVQSKKAFQHGEKICFHAHQQSNASAQAAVDVLALDAKVRWVRDAILEQLKLAASVARSIEEKRAYIGKQVQEWDTSRTLHTNALDSILEALSSQYVPPDFHQSSSDSSIFGSQHSDSDTEDIREADHELGNGERRHSLESQTKDVSVSPQLESPAATLRLRQRKVSTKSKCEGTDDNKGSKKKQDRTRWKTLRDFVDDQALEELLEMIDVDRLNLDKTLSKTSDYPESLHATISSIQSSLPQTESSSLVLDRVQKVLEEQQEIANEMAKSLESLGAHYEQMAEALEDHEAGEIFSEDDMQAMNRDTDELPIILAELEDNARRIENQLNHLLSLKETNASATEALGRTLADLDELGFIMEDMLDEQESTEKNVEESLSTLHEQLEHLEQLHQHYVGFRKAFSRLIIEMKRRLLYREAMDEIVKRMATQLEEMANEEAHSRSQFNIEHGQLLPEDICLSISNPPTRWQIMPWEGESREVLPDIDADLVKQAEEHLGIEVQFESVIKYSV